MGETRRGRHRWGRRRSSSEPEHQGRSLASLGLGLCHDLKAWAESRPGSGYTTLDPPFVTHRNPPQTIEPEVDDTFAALLEYPVPERALVHIPGALLLGQCGLVITPENEIAGQLIALTPQGRESVVDSEAVRNEPVPDRIESMAGNFYAVLGFGAHHYYHWGHDLIMGMRGIDGLLPPDIQLILPERVAAFQADMVGLLPLGQQPRISFPLGSLWELENLFVVVPRLKTQIDSPEPFDWFRSAAIARYGIGQQAPTRRLYLSRRDDGHWKTTNEQEVEGVLARFGFETVTPGRMTFREQVELFGAAEMIVGTGAGLFNMVFAPTGVGVLQFQDPSHMIHALWTTAEAVGAQYHYFLCEPIPNRRGRIADLHVPPAKLEMALARMVDSDGRR